MLFGFPPLSCWSSGAPQVSNDRRPAGIEPGARRAARWLASRSSVESFSTTAMSVGGCYLLPARVGMLRVTGRRPARGGPAHTRSGGVDLRRAGTIGACSTTARSTATACCCVDEVGMLRIHGPTPGGRGSRGQKWVSKHCGRRQTLRAPSRYLTENIFLRIAAGGEVRQGQSKLLPA